MLLQIDAQRIEVEFLAFGNRLGSDELFVHRISADWKGNLARSLYTRGHGHSRIQRIMRSKQDVRQIPRNWRYCSNMASMVVARVCFCSCAYGEKFTMRATQSASCAPTSNALMQPVVCARLPRNRRWPVSA